MFLAVPLLFLWFILINQLRVEWALNPQYGYGWAVPVLCLYLVWQRVQASRISPTLLCKAWTKDLPSVSATCVAFIQKLLGH